MAACWAMALGELVICDWSLAAAATSSFGPQP